MALNVQQVAPAVQFTGTEGPKRKHKLFFEGAPALKADTVKFTGAEQVVQAPAVKSLLGKALEFVKTKGKVVVDFVMKAIKFVASLPAKLMGLIKKAPPPPPVA